MAIIIFRSPAFGYVISETSSGLPLHIDIDNQLIIDYEIDIDGIDESEVDSFLASLADSLSSDIGAKILFNKKGVGSKFKITGSSNKSFFSSNAVAAVTRITHDDDGEILAANIIINLNVKLNDDVDSRQYFGNVISHEVGHSLGLDHSPSWGATMRPDLSIGQHSWEGDDITGAKVSANLPLEFKGEVTGRLIGGNVGAKIFGAVVDLVDFSTLKIVQSQISGKEGDFRFLNVNKSKEYLLLYGPFDYDNTYQDKFQSSFKSFCLDRDDYTYTFLSSCLNSYDAIPRIIKFSDQNAIDIGDLGIKCDLPSSRIIFDYSIKRINDENNIISDSLSHKKDILLGGVIVGGEDIKIPIKIQNVGAGESLRISILNQILRSPLLVHPKLIDLDTGESLFFHDLNQANFGGVNVPLFEGLPSNNFSKIFSLKTGDQNNFNIEIEVNKLKDIINSSDNDEFTEGSFSPSPINKSGALLIGFKVLSADESDNLRSDQHGVTLENDYFGCSTAINSFEIPRVPMETPKIDPPQSSAGCSAIARSGNMDETNDFIYFILEFWGYMITYCAFRRFCRP